MAGQGKGALRIAIEDFFETYVSEGIGGYLHRKANERRDELIESYDAFLTELGIADAMPKAFRPGSPVPIVAAAVAALPFLLGVMLSAGMSMAAAALAPIGTQVALAVSKTVKSWRPDPSMLTALQRRFPQHEEVWAEVWDELGIPEDMVDLVPQVMIPTIPEGDLLTLWYRDETLRPELEAELSRRGWTDDRVANLIKVREVLPGVQDLILFAVREAFRDDIAEKFELDADFPTDITPFAEQIGLSEFWLEKYWRSHWQLPSVQAGYSMLHRLRPGVVDRPFTQEDLETLLRTADIPRFFRERLIDISFSTFTRVDVRRMYRVGILDQAGVQSAYEDLGYNEVMAGQMTEFTIKLETQAQRDLTRTNITDGYKRQVLTRAQAVDALIAIGYTDADAEYFVSIIDVDQAKADIDDAIDEAEFLYMEGEINDTGVYALLNPLNLPAEQIAKLIMRFEIRRRKKRALPSKGDLEDFYRRDLITAEMLQEGLSKRRFDDDTIGLYMLRLDERVAEQAAREAERAQREQERIEGAEFKTEYQRLKAELDVRIAEARLAIADLKLSKHLVTEPDEIDRIKEDIDIIKVTIADLQLQKANVKLEGVT